jgi:hypothetical protein
MPTPYPNDAAIIRIGSAMFARTLPKPEWTHAAHVATTIWVTAARPDLVPARDLPPAIRAYNEATGGENTDTAGYHETITQASIRAIAGAMKRHPGLSLAGTCATIMASHLGDPHWLLAYWSTPVLFSVQARRSWVEPDVCGLPF